MLLNQEFFVTVLVVGAATVGVQHVIESSMFDRGLRTFFQKVLHIGSAGVALRLQRKEGELGYF